MNKQNFSAIALAVSLMFSGGVFAQSMSEADYKASKDKISAEYKTGKASCSSLSGNASDICVAEAKGKEKVARADLEASYKPTPKNQYKARVAKAEADYAVANERCDDAAGNAKDVCVKEAKAARTAAKADAKAQMKTTDAKDAADKKSADANATAREKTADARSESAVKASEARKDATADKVDANYSVAKEKCDIYSGAAKDTCLNQAKVRFGK